MQAATTVRLKPGLISAVKNEQARERRSSQTETIACLIEDGLELRGILNFNKGCHQIGLNQTRDAFHAWCKENDVPAYNTIDAWENYARQFEIDGDDSDQRATQNDALDDALGGAEMRRANGSRYWDWLHEIEQAHPGCTVKETRYGCALYDDDGFVADFNYEPDPDYEALARY